jgi:hypothetical protein
VEGGLGSKVVNGETPKHWQYEATGGGRLCYCIDDSRRLVWLTEAGPGHPKATE